MIISLAGYPGSGKSTVGKLLAKKLEYKKYSMGDLRRAEARERGMTLEEWNKFGETSEETDIPVDKRLEKLGKEEDNFVIDSRLAWYFVPNSFKVFLNVDPTVGAKRIYGDIKSGDRPEQKQYSSLDEVIQADQDRTDSDNRRYDKYYGVKWDDFDNFDLMLDTSDTSPEEVVEKIIDKMSQKQ